MIFFMYRKQLKFNIELYLEGLQQKHLDAAECKELTKFDCPNGVKQYLQSKQLEQFTWLVVWQHNERNSDDIIASDNSQPVYAFCGICVAAKKIQVVFFGNNPSQQKMFVDGTRDWRKSIVVRNTAAIMKSHRNI